MYRRFGLVLMVTHACNLRCSYCYSGAKVGRSMEAHVGTRAIDRALASMDQGGTLELSFFGGEPLLEAGLVGALVDYARSEATRWGMRVAPAVTTNGTVANEEAFAVMMREDMSLSVSQDGMPANHDRYRRFACGKGSSDEVLTTMRRLMDAGKQFTVVTVVRPDTVDDLPRALRFFHGMGVRAIHPTLDLWTGWSRDAIERLERAIARAARLWVRYLPDLAVSWFDEKAAHIAGVSISDCARCGFGAGEVAVAPSGNLYPCERLIGADEQDNPMKLPGYVFDGGEDFLETPAAPARSTPACRECAMASVCNTTCRCSNFVRSGRVDRPDLLLCAVEKACLLETRKALEDVRVKATA